MIKKRMSLSLLALIGSVFLFVAASFAWFAVSNITNINQNIFNVQDIDVTAEFFTSDDGVTYVSATNIEFLNDVPGDIKYYKIVVVNNNDFDINTQVSLHGFNDSVADSSGDTTNYTAGRSLTDVLLLNSSNNVNSDTIINQTLTSLITSGSFVITHDNVTIVAQGTAEFYFSFTVSSTLAGNNYQNLKLDIDKLYVQSVD